LAAERENTKPEHADDVPAEDLAVWRDDHHHLNVKVGETTHENVRALRLFPVSGKSAYISFVGSKGKEVALLKKPEELDADSRDTLEHAFDRHYYTPKIVRVDRISETWGVGHWEVMTDCGYASFEIVARENIRNLGGGRYLMEDVDGNRFEIPAVSQLDARSQALIRSET